MDEATERQIRHALRGELNRLTLWLDLLQLDGTPARERVEALEQIDDAAGQVVDLLDHIDEIEDLDR